MPETAPVTAAGTRVRDDRHLHLDRHGPVDAPRVPVLLVPPPAAPVSCYHLRPGLSLRDHLVERGHPVHVLDHGPISRRDRDLGFTRLVDEVLPTAVRAASNDLDRPVVPLGWSIAGTLTLFTLAAHPHLPVAGAVAIGAPFDYGEVPHLWPLQLVGRLTPADRSARPRGGSPGSCPPRSCRPPTEAWPHGAS